MNTVSSTLQGAGIDLGGILKGLLALALVFVPARFLSRLLYNVVIHRLSDRAFGRNGPILVARLTTIVVYVFAFLIALGQLGVSSTGLLTFLSAFTVALGISLQDVFKNFFSGVILLLERPFHVGDFIRVRTVDGEVQGIDVRTTMVKVDDGSLVMVPNSIIFSEILFNRSKAGLRRIDLAVTATGMTVVETERLIHESLESMAEVSQPIPSPAVMAASPEETKLVASILVTDSPLVRQQVVDTLIAADPDGRIKVDRV